MTSGISLSLCAGEGKRRCQDDVRARRTLWLGLAALFYLSSAVLAARGAELIGRLDLGKDPYVRAFAFSPDSRLLALYSNQVEKEQAVTIWDVATKKRIAVLNAESGATYYPFCFTPDGKQLIVNGTSVTVWDVGTFKEIRRINLEKSEESRGPVLFTPDGKSMIVASLIRGVQVYDMATGKRIKIIQREESPITQPSAMTVSPDGKMVAVGTKGGQLFICDLDKGEVRHEIPDAGAGLKSEGGAALQEVHLLAFSPDNKRLVSYADGRRVQVWDTATGKNLDFLLIGNVMRGLEALAFSPDGKTLAMAGTTVRLWDIGANGFRNDFHIDLRDAVRHLAFSPDGKTLATAGLNITVKFWDLPAGAPKSVEHDPTPPESNVETVIINGRLFIKLP